MPREYVEMEGLRYVYIKPTRVSRAGKIFQRDGHYRIIGPVEYVPNGRRRELSEEHKRRIAESLRKAPNGRRSSVERRRRVTRLPVDERIEYLEDWAEKEISA